MKKGFLITSVIVVSLCLLLVGCGGSKEKEDNTETQTKNGKSGEWFNYGLVVNNNKPEDITSKFLRAERDVTEDYLEPVTLLGTQVVAGTNYMFLCRVMQDKPLGEELDSADLRVAILYVDLQGNAEITKVTKFDVNKYVSKDISLTQEQLAGGWTVSNKFTSKVSYDSGADEKVAKATSTLAGASFKALAVLSGKKVSNAEMYDAILCLQTTGIETSTPKYSLSVLTIKGEGEDEYTYTLESIADLNLADFNK